MSFRPNHYQIQVKDQLGLNGHSSDGNISSGCLVMVYDAGTKTLSTLGSDENMTSKTNPISRSQFATDGLIDFWSAGASHDLFVAHSDGSVDFYAGLTPTNHSLVLDRNGVDKCLIAPFSVVSTTETDTGLDFPRNVLITAVLIEVTTNDSGEALNVGLLSSESLGDADGLLVALSLATAGFVKPVVTTAGTGETYISTAAYGLLMGPAKVGTNTDGDFGMASAMGHVINATTAVSLVYSNHQTNADTGVGYIYAYFKHLR